MIMATGKKTFKGTVTGLVTGAVNGLFGGGGGMVAVPLLKNMLGYEDKQSHATAIFVIAPVCAASAIVYIANGYASADVIIPAAIGSVAGPRRSLIPQIRTRKSFGCGGTFGRLSSE